MSTTTALQFPLISATVIDGESTNTINARKLHDFLEVETTFNVWISRRIKKYGFVENIDYIAINQKRSLGSGRGFEDYLINIDMAKELAMLERNEKGRAVRKHFIKAEKIALISTDQIQHLQNQINQLQKLIPLDKTDRRIIQMKGFKNDQGQPLSHRLIASIVGLSKDTVRVRVRRLESLGKLTPPPNLRELQNMAQHLNKAGC